MRDLNFPGDKYVLSISYLIKPGEVRWSIYIPVCTDTAMPSVQGLDIVDYFYCKARPSYFHARHYSCHEISRGFG